MNVAAAEKCYLARDQESEGIEVVRSQGSYLFDAKRRKYVDFMMGWCVGNFGWNNDAPAARRSRSATVASRSSGCVMSRNVRASNSASL